MAKHAIPRESRDTKDIMLHTRSVAASKRKPRSLPPPREAMQDAMLDAMSVSKKKASAKKPAATKKALAKAPSGVNKTSGAKKGRPPKTKLIGFMQELDNLSATADQYVNKRTGMTGVLFRPTARALKYKKEIAATSPIESITDKTPIKVEGKGEHVFKLMKLPKDVRARIWRYAVVYPSLFVRPETEIGREQPDLAMVCRRIRKEVLPIFYSENIFAVNITPTAAASKVKPKSPSDVKQKFFGTGTPVPESIAIIDKWAAALRHKRCEYDWFGMIRKWCFSYDPKSTNRSSPEPSEEDRSLIVSVRYHKKDDGWWANDGVEVHREGCCVLPGRPEFQRCVIRRTPEWLNAAVYSMFDAARHKDIPSEMIVNLAITIKDGVTELVGNRCEVAIRSIEDIDSEMSEACVKKET